ncbi:hypothetical protein TVAGG3_0516520 [Trichomonas vaginalis G3]|nr:hypothetical protein TVAGG3_0516520 [Trichomonas vaginalis G3]KAI5518173.1 hypothetical protein TVAGG3_0516520 [Trichomonas vaginalis G3]
MRVSANLTVTALITSHISRSPYFQLTMNNAFTKLQVKNCHFNKFTAPLVQSFSKNTHILLKSSRATNFLQSVLRVDSTAITYREVVENAVTNLNMGRNVEDVACQEMIFKNCTTAYDGGAVFVIIGGIFYCNFTAFDNCFTNPDYIGGAVYCIANATNFTGDCFRSCSAKKGCAVMNPETNYQFSMKLCQMNDIIPDATNPARVVDVYARDILILGSNMSNVKLSQIVRFIPTQNFVCNFTNYENAVVDGAEYKAMFKFHKMNRQMYISYVNFNNCSISNSGSDLGYLFNINGFSITINNSIIVKSTFDSFSTGDNVTVYISNSVFDFAKDKITNVTVVDDNVTFAATDAKPLALTAVSTEGCWFHSTYKWERPPLKSQGLILGFMALAVIVTVCILIWKKRSLDKQKPVDEDDEAEMLMAGSGQ